MLQKRAVEQPQPRTSKPQQSKNQLDPIERMRSWLNWAVPPAKPSVEGYTRDGKLRGVMFNGKGDAIRNWHEHSEKKEKYERDRKVQPKQPFLKKRGARFGTLYFILSFAVYATSETIHLLKIVL